MSADYLTGPTHTVNLLAHHIVTSSPRHGHSTGHDIRRQPDAHQGQALEILGHAIEYLVDSQLQDGPRTTPNPLNDASQILMRLSREVFAECREIVPLRRRLWTRLRHLIRAIPAA